MKKQIQSAFTGVLSVSSSAVRRVFAATALVIIVFVHQAARAAADQRAKKKTRRGELFSRRCLSIPPGALARSFGGVLRCLILLPVFLALLVPPNLLAAASDFTRTNAEIEAALVGGRIQESWDAQPWLKLKHEWQYENFKRGVSIEDSDAQFMRMLRDRAPGYFPSAPGVVKPDLQSMGNDALGVLGIHKGLKPVLGTLKSLWNPGWNLVKGSHYGKTRALLDGALDGNLRELYENGVIQLIADDIRANNPAGRSYLEDLFPNGQPQTIDQLIEGYPGSSDVLALRTSKGINLTEEQALAIFKKLIGKVQNVSEETLAVVKQQAAEQRDFYAWMKDEVAQREAQEKRAHQRQVNDAKLQATQNAFGLLSTFVGFDNPELAGQISVVGSAAISIASGLNAMDGTALGSAILTGNVLGAATGLIGMFGKKGPSPDQEILKGIGVIKAMLNQIRQEMHQRFDVVDKKLDLIYQTMNERLDQLDLQLGQIRGDVDEIQTALFDLQADLNRVERKLMSYLKTEFRRPLIDEAAKSIGYWEAFGIAMPYEYYINRHLALLVWAAIKASDGTSAPYLGRGYDDASVAIELSGEEENINYIKRKLELLGIAPIASNPLPNRDDWLLAMMTELRMMMEWPEHAARVSSDHLKDMVRPGQELLEAISRITLLESGTGKVANRQLFNVLFANYRAKAALFKQRLQECEDEYRVRLAQELKDLTRIEALKRLDLWGAAGQSTAWRPPLTNVRPAKSAVTHGVTDPLALPLNWASLVPPPALTADLLGVAPLALSYSTFDAVNPTARVLKWANNEAYFTAGQFRIVVQVESGTVPVVAWCIETGSWTNPSTQVISPYLTDAWFIPETPLNAKLGIITTKNGQFYHYATYGNNIGWAQALQLLWNGGSLVYGPNNGAVSGGGHMHINATVPLRNAFVTYAQNASGTLPPQDLAQRVREVEIRLRELQRGNYRLVSSALSEASSIQAAANQLSGAKALLESVIELGLSESVKKDDFIRALLYGADRIVDREAALELCDLGITRSRDTSQVAKTDIGSILDKRIDALEFWVNDRLTQIQASGRSETLRNVEAAVHQVEAVIAAQEGDHSSGDNQRPSVAISKPAAGARLTTADVLLEGTAGDDQQVREIMIYKELGDPIVTADGGKKWSAPLKLSPGQNEIHVVSLDVAGNISKVTSRTLHYVVTEPLEIAINGEGTISGELGKPGERELGRDYSATAKAKPGFLFSHWSLGGTVTSSSPTVTITMQPGMTLAAHFVPNPFPAVAGIFNGVYHEQGQVRHGSGGFFTGKLTNFGKFTASVMQEGKRYGVVGILGLDGKATTQIKRARKSPLNVEWQVDLHGDAISGTITDGTWTAFLAGGRSSFSAPDNLSPEAGRYTMVIPGDADPANAPSGDTIGTVVISKKGVAKVIGCFADGHRASHAAALTNLKDLPLYAGAKDSLFLGQVRFTDHPDEDFGGRVAWIRTPVASSRFYPDGFSVQSEASGSRYFSPSNSESVPGFTDGVVEFSGRNLAAPITNEVKLAPPNRVINIGNNRMTMRMDTATGLISGSLDAGNKLGNFLLKGVVHQKGDYGAGYFLGPDQSGRIYLSLAP